MRRHGISGRRKRKRHRSPPPAWLPPPSRAGRGMARAWWWHPNSVDKEAQALRVDSAKAMRRLGWRPRWPAAQAIEATMAWYRRLATQPDADMAALSLGQIAAFAAA